MKQQTKQIIFSIFGISCKAVFHILAFVATYYHCRKVFVVLLSIWIIHNIVSILAYKGKWILTGV